MLHPRFCYTIAVASSPRHVVRGAAAVSASVAALAALAALADARPHGARPARASATAYARQDDHGRHRAVHATGDSTRTRPGVGAVTATRGGHGSARAYARVKHVSIFKGLLRAASVLARASASGQGAGADGRVAQLSINGHGRGSPTHRRVYQLDGYGYAIVLDPASGGIAGIRATLTHPYKGIPAGSTVTVAFAAASASDAVAAPAAPPRRRPAHPHATPPSKSKPPVPHAKRRVPPRVRLLNTKRGFTFPVYGAHDYTDTFGAARADTGFHEGNDIFAAAGTPIVAVTSGTLNRVGTLKVSGNRLWVKSDRGDSFFYAHLSAFAADDHNGLRVKAGQVIGFVGSTGDAEKTPPHLHFEVHPGDGPAVDPYPFLRAWEGRRDVPAAAWLVHYARDAGTRPGTLVEVRDFLSG